MKHFLKLILLCLAVTAAPKALPLDITPVAEVTDTIYNPDIIYTPIPRSYEIAGIKVKGIPDEEQF